MNFSTPELRHEMASLSVTTFVDLMRNEPEPISGDSARELIRLSHLVRVVRPVDADAIIEEATSLALTEITDEYRKRNSGYRC